MEQTQSTATATGAPEPSSQPSTPAAEPQTQQPSYVQELVGEPTITDIWTNTVEQKMAPRPEPQPTETVEQPQPQETAPEPQEPQPERGETVDQIIQSLAQEHKIDLATASDDMKRVLKRAADKELFIRKLQAKNQSAIAGHGQTQDAGATASTPADAPPPQLTATEQLLQGEETPVAAPPQTNPAQQPAPQTGTAPQEPQPMRFGDVGDNWKSPADAVTALNEAYATEDPAKVAEVMEATHRRYIAAMTPEIIRSEIQRLFPHLVQRELGDVLPVVRQMTAEQQNQANVDTALAEMKQIEAFKGFDKMFEADKDEPLKFNGQEYPNTPYNRVLAENPDIINIRVTHDAKGRPIKDPNVAARATYQARWKMAAKILKMQAAPALDPAKAAQLVQNGQEMQKRQEQDRVRQSLNAGAGATGLPAGQGEQSYAQSLLSSAGTPIDSLWK